jgi:hypothetical protein
MGEIEWATFCQRQTFLSRRGGHVIGQAWERHTNVNVEARVGKQLCVDPEEEPGFSGMTS